MAASATVDIGTLITRTPGVYGGRPCLAGTRFPVMQIALMHNEGLTPEQMTAEYSFLDLTAIYAAVAYYLANKAAVDADIAEFERVGREGLAAQRARSTQ
ncbi:MAG: DUF433 domain-containing protein [Dehalococcoidia bacterium]